MDIPLKKIELIEWLTSIEDENILDRIDSLRKKSVKRIYQSRIPTSAEDLQEKLDRSEEDIKSGRTYTQEEVETYFKKNR